MKNNIQKSTEGITSTLERVKEDFEKRHPHFNFTKSDEIIIKQELEKAREEGRKEAIYNKVVGVVIVTEVEQEIRVVLTDFMRKIKSPTYKNKSGFDYREEAIKDIQDIILKHGNKKSSR